MISGAPEGSAIISCFTSGTYRVTFVKNAEICHEVGIEDRVVTTTNETYPRSSMIQIFRNLFSKREHVCDYMSYLIFIGGGNETNREKKSPAVRKTMTTFITSSSPDHCLE